jgi:hypothetical protein
LKLNIPQYLINIVHTLQHLTIIEAPNFLISDIDRGVVPDLLVSGDNFDLVVVDPHDQTTTSETQSTTLRTMCGSRTGGWSLPGVMVD